MKQRRLFPVLTENHNISCPDLCVDSTCPYGCYPYSEMYPFQPPSPPLLETAPPSLNKHSQHISAYIIVIIAVLATCFLLISYYLVRVKYCSGWNLFRPRRRQPQAAAEEVFLEENRGPEIVHPIWYINTVGLQPSIINSITIFRYKRGETLIDGTDCSVCLNEFQNGETLRLLPKCNHAFHIPCIDTWLRSHTNCPVCRAGIMSNALAAPLASNGHNSNIISHSDDSQVDNSAEINGELNDSNQERDDNLRANEADSEDAIQFPQIVHVSQGTDNEKLSLDSKENGASLVLGNFKAKSLVLDENQKMQPIRRSLSVNSLVAANISEAVLSLCVAESEEISLDPRLDVQHHSAKHAGGNSGIQRIVGGSSISQFLHKKPLRMKRSFSYSGMSFVSRQYARSNSILPM